MVNHMKRSGSTSMSSISPGAPDTMEPTPIMNVDTERTSEASIVLPLDPFNIREGFLTEEQIAELRRRRKGKQVAKFYERQNDLIRSLLKPMQEHTEDARAEEDAARIPVKIAVQGSLIANICLCILQMYAAISGGSLSLLETGIDSLFDAGSNFLLFWLHRKATRLDINKWPVGGARVETIGNIVYGFLMGSVNLVVIVESVRSLATKPSNDLKVFHLPSILAVAVALGVKILLFFYCYSLRNKSSQVQVLWEDHRNDLFINGFGILMATGGSKLVWYLDPMGAIIVSLTNSHFRLYTYVEQIAVGVLFSWSLTVYKEFGLLAGKSAPHDFLQLVIYKALTFSDDIIKIDTVRAYHSGPDYFVEVDVVMDATTPLWKAHDLSQQLQDKIEVLPNVERAFVHVDHETTHYPEHRKIP
ncbi:CDF-like metal transporter [Tricholoma matsutake]|nr:CDF-like metal transporter [Tricholoma matsutake 945]